MTVIKSESNDSMIPQVDEIREAIKCGLQDKALSMMGKNKHYLSKRDIYNLWIDPKIDISIKEWLYTKYVGKYLIEMTQKRLKINDDICWSGSNVITLLKNGEETAVALNKQFGHASLYGELEVLKFLSTHDTFDPSFDDNYALRAASAHGRIKVVKILLDDERVDPSAQGDYAFCFACAGGHLDVAKRLLFCETVDLTVCTNYALRVASLNGHSEIVKLLMTCESIDMSDVDNEAIRGASRNKSV